MKSTNFASAVAPGIILGTTFKKTRHVEFVIYSVLFNIINVNHGRVLIPPRINLV